MYAYSWRGDIEESLLDSWRGDSAFKTKYPQNFRLYLLHEAHTFYFFIVLDKAVQWNFHFFRNLNELEYIELTYLLGILEGFSPQGDGSMVWGLEGSRFFSCKFFFLLSSALSKLVPFQKLIKFGNLRSPLWSTFVWLVIHSRVNTQYLGVPVELFV